MICSMLANKETDEADNEASTEALDEVDEVAGDVEEHFQVVTGKDRK